MLHVDYNWDCTPNGILLDEEFNSDRLGWKAGDLFEFVNINGRQMLRKIDPVVAFARGQKVNCNEK